MHPLKKAMKRRIETHPETRIRTHTNDKRPCIFGLAGRRRCTGVLFLRSAVCSDLCLILSFYPGFCFGFLFGARRTAAAESGYWRCRRWTAAEDDGRPPLPIKSPAKKAQGHSLSGMALGLICFGSAPYASGKSVTSGSWPDGRRPARWDRPPGTARCSRARRCRSQGPRGVPRCRLRCTA